VVQACQTNNLNPCNVGYLFDIKASSLDVAIRDAFNKATAGKVKVLAEGESFFTPAKGLAATQNMLQAHKDINLIVGSDQGIEGAVQALGKSKKVVLVGYGASAAAIQGVSSGAWFGDVAQLPATEGRLAVQAAVKAVQSGTTSGGVDPVGALPSSGVVTKDNAKQFTAEWPG
jgi:ribose transport system substrate-binding protein